MCLGIPGRIVGFDATTDQLARAEVLGTERIINVGLLTDERLAVGDWVIVHLGFALEVVDAAGAEAALRGLELMGRPDPLGDGGPPSASASATPGAAEGAT